MHGRPGCRLLTGVLRELLALGDGGRAMSERTATTVYGSLGAASCAVLRRRRGSSSRSSRINLLWLCARDAEDDAPGASTSEALHRPNLLARSARRRPARRSPLERCGGVRRIAVGLPGLGAPREGSVAAAGARRSGPLIACQHALLLVHDPVPVEDRAARVSGEEPRPSFRDTRSSQGPPGVATSGAPSRRPPALVPDDRATVGSVWPMAAPVA